MEFLHLKDMRAACMEPINVISGYKWQGGLGYYESTRDAATHFFFDRVPRALTFSNTRCLFHTQAVSATASAAFNACMHRNSAATAKEFPLMSENKDHDLQKSPVLNRGFLFKFYIRIWQNKNNSIPFRLPTAGWKTSISFSGSLRIFPGA